MSARAFAASSGLTSTLKALLVSIGLSFVWLVALGATSWSQESLFYWLIIGAHLTFALFLASLACRRFITDARGWMNVPAAFLFLGFSIIAFVTLGTITLVVGGGLPASAVLMSPFSAAFYAWYVAFRFYFVVAALAVSWLAFKWAYDVL